MPEFQFDKSLVPLLFFMAPRATSNAKDTPMDRLITIEEFTRRFGVGRSTVYREHNSGRLPFRKIGRATRIAESDARTWLEGLQQC